MTEPLKISGPDEPFWERVRPQFSPIISMGNVITIIGLIVPLAWGGLTWMTAQQSRLDTLEASIVVERVSRLAAHKALAQREAIDNANLHDQLTADSQLTQQQLAAIQAILQDIQHRIDRRWDKHAGPR